MVDGTDAGGVEWRLRRRWLLIAAAGSGAWAAAWIAGYAAFGVLDRVVGNLYVVCAPFLFTVAAVAGRRIRLTAHGVEYVGGLSRLSVDWSDVEAVDRRHLTYALARETTNDTGLKISIDRFVRAAPRRHRRIPLRPFVDDARYRTLLERLQVHRPDLEPG